MLFRQWRNNIFTLNIRRFLKQETVKRNILISNTHILNDSPKMSYAVLWQILAHEL